MKLMTKEIEAIMPPLYAQEDAGEEAIAYVKYFDPLSGWTWYGMEYENGEFFGYVVGFEAEYGYFTLRELETAGHGRIERDLYFKPTAIKDIKAMHHR